MSLSRPLPARIAVLLAVLLAVLGSLLAPAPTALAHGGHDDDDGDVSLSSADEPLFLAHDASLFDPIAAPFACGTEWSGGTRAGHGQNDWNLDFNRTSLVWPDRQHDLGQPLFAQADGVATYIGWQVNAGTYLDIDYGDYAARYIHMVDDSIPFEVGTVVSQGDFIGQLGDTGNTPGFAHLHLEYWDSRFFDDARIWTLKQNGQPQTEVTFDDNVVDPNEVIVSTNCVGAALEGGIPPEPEVLPDPATLPEVGQLVASFEAEGRSALLAALLEHATPVVVDAGDETDFEFDGGIVATVPGDDLADAAVLVVATVGTFEACADVEADADCYTATRDGSPAAALTELLRSIEAPRRDVHVAIIEGDDPAAGLASLLADPDLSAELATVVAAVHVGPLGESASVALRNDSLAMVDPNEWDWSTLAGLTEHPTELQWHTTSVDPTARPGVAALDALAVPVVSMSDLPGPCSIARDTNYGDIDHRKLAAQTEILLAVVAALADADTTPAHAVVDTSAVVVADLTTLDGLREEAGFDIDAGFDQIHAFLFEPPDPITSETADTMLGLATTYLANAIAELECEPYANPAPFADVNGGSFAVHDVGLLFDLEITNGTSPTSYGPTDPVTRQQMAAFLGRIWRLHHPDYAPSVVMPFGDVAEASYAYDDIRFLVEYEITVGLTPSAYGPDVYVNRAQMASFLARLWRALHPSYDESVVDTHPFVDVDAGSFAHDDISLIFHLGITTGTSETTYAPGENVTREQMAAFLARLIRAADAEPFAPPSPGSDDDTDPPESPDEATEEEDPSVE
ncbi:MAG: S-layer homology domain-containing protein [Actinomycetota bacterium]